MQKSWFALILVALNMPVFALAQQVPAIERTSVAVPSRTSLAPIKNFEPLPVLSADEIKLNPQQQRAVTLANQWKNKPEMPLLGEEGLVKFAFGTSFPSVICAPLYACDVALQVGEIITQVDVGDAVRWKITPAISGRGDTTITHLVIKPADVGLSTNLLIHTDRRTYNLQLVSKKESWMPNVAFTYPDDPQAQWAAYHQQQAARKSEQASTSAPVPQVAQLNFNYRLQGGTPRWKPIRVYADFNKTYIQFPPKVKNSEIPALVILGAGKQEQLVNYRLNGDRFVVDQVIDHAALIYGMGRHQERIEIIREER
jgi:P-type conjugative transfer protein TrbG